MAQKRMFSVKITETDAFLEMPISAQCLYFHLNMNADDEGIVSNPKTVMRKIGANDGDMKTLIQEKFVLIFPENSRIILIKHWLIHNTIQSDRKKVSAYSKEMEQIEVKNNKSYRLKEEMFPTCIQNVSKVETQYRLDKTRLDKYSNNIVEFDESNTDISIFKQVIDYLNLKANTNFRHSASKTKAIIQARINEKYVLSDFKEVIDKKCAEWLNTEWAKYLRPNTLFGNKFDQYLNQKGLKQIVQTYEPADSSEEEKQKILEEIKKMKK